MTHFNTMSMNSFTICGGTDSNNKGCQGVVSQSFAEHPQSDKFAFKNPWHEDGICQFESVGQIQYYQKKF